MIDERGQTNARQQLDAALQALAELTGGPPDHTEPAPAVPVAQPGDLRPAPAAAVVGAPAEAPASAPAATPVATAAPAHDNLTTMLRLFVGAALLGGEALAQRAPLWEQQAATETAQPAATSPVAPLQPVASVSTTGPDAEGLRHALVGWLFVTQEQLRLQADPRQWLANAGSHFSQTATLVLRETLLPGLGRRRGQPTTADDAELHQLITRGVAEERHSKALLRVALADITTTSRPVIQDLVQEQTTTMAGEVLDALRERTVSADQAVDRLVGRLTRRRPVATAPEVAVGEQRQR